MRHWVNFIAYTLIGIVFLFSTSVVAQQTPSNIKGVVKDTKGEPVIGASILVKGTSNGTISDYDGKFELRVNEAKANVVVSYIGFKQQEKQVMANSFATIVLVENQTELDEVQVIAYGTQKKVTVTGAISSVQSKELLKSPVGSLTNALTGKLPGVSTVQYSGRPGADDAVVFIRGNGSPLVLVDGVERSFSQIDPNEIEDITVLKDASATAVFGIRGASGVILVTSKRGEKGKARISVSSSASLQEATRLPKFADSYTWANFYNEMKLNDNPNATDIVGETALEAFRTGSDPLLYPSIDWVDYLTNKYAFQSQHNVNISGGSDKLRYFVSAGLYTQEGIFKNYEPDYKSNFDYRRYNYRANLDYNITKDSKLTLNIGGRVQDSNQPNSSNTQDEIFRFIYRAAPYAGAGIVDGKRIVSNPQIQGLINGSIDGLDVLYGRGFSSTVLNVLNADFAFEQKLDFVAKGLSFNVKGAINSSYSITKTRSKTTPFYTPIKNTDGTIGFRKSADETELNFGETYNADRNYYTEAALNYKRKFGDHNVSALALFNQSKTYYPDKPAVYKGLPRGYVGLVGRVTYDYKTKYLLDFNVGYNGSENFAEEQRYGFFPAGSIGWIATQEDFLKDQKVISYLKLRASYGVVGDDKLGDYRFMYLSDPYNINQTGYFFGTNVGTAQPGIAEGTKGNPNITWDNASKQNYGIDLYLFKDKLKINADIFSEHRTDILLTRNAPPGFLGFTPPVVNMGIVDTKGYEVSVAWTDKVNNKFKYWINTNISYAKTNRVEIDEVKPAYDYMRLTGTPRGTSRYFKFWDFYDEGANDRYKSEFGIDIPNHGVTLKPGDALFEDLNKDGVIDNNDQKPLGYAANPQYVGSFSAGFEYNKFEFSMMWTGATKASRYLSESLNLPLGEQNFAALLQHQYDNRWTPETAETATLPRPSQTNRSNNYRLSDLFLIDASYLRLKNVEIAYNISASSLKKAGINNIRIFLTGNNLLTFDYLKVVDPESNTSNTPSYPLMKVYNVGVKLEF